MALSRAALRRLWGAVAARGGSLALGLVLLLINLALVNYLAARHHLRTDWTSTKTHSLSAKTVDLLQGLTRPVRVTLFMVTPHRMEPSLYPEIRELLRRFSGRSRMIRLEQVDLDLDPTRAQLLAKRFDVRAAELREGGVALQAGNRTTFVPVAAMATYAMRGGRRVAAFRGEAALLEALLAVTTRQRPVLCFTRDHGEAPAESYVEAGYGYIADELKRDGFVVKVVGTEELLAGSRGCRVLVIGGPQTGFAQPELDALDRFLRQGGRLLVLLGPVLDRKATRQRRIGLEGLLASWGIQVLDNIVVDRLAVPGEQPLLTWATRDGYAGGHPVSRALQGLVTVWPLVREVRPGRPQYPGVRTTALVRTSADGWAETDLASLRGDRPLRLDPSVDTPGPVSVAVAAELPARGSRLVVLGTERGVLNRRQGRATIRDYNRDLMLAAASWLAGAERQVAVGPRIPERVEVALDARQIGRVFLMCVVGLPTIGLLCGLVVWRRRRR
jgi:ABC-type uncharacterized transport system involved in gliding motility auxiliary subunit